MNTVEFLRDLIIAALKERAERQQAEAVDKARREVDAALGKYRAAAKRAGRDYEAALATKTAEQLAQAVNAMHEAGR